MIRTRLATSHLKRTLRPLYGFTQATPKSVFLDAAWDRSIPIWPGMVLMKTVGENATLIGTGASAVPYGLCGHYIGGDGIDEPLEVGLNAISAWVLAPDAEFEVLSPAFDDTQAWAEVGDGTEKLVYAIVAGTGRGKLALATNGAVATTLSTAPVARLLKVNSASKITIGGVR